MGLVTRFERGGRKDAVLRSTEGDEIAVEWEWGGAWGNELGKLRDHRVWSLEKGKERLLRYAVFITYTHTPNIELVYRRVMKEWHEQNERNEWKGARWPLILILIDVVDSKLPMGRDFNNMNMSIFDVSVHGNVDASGQTKEMKQPFRVAPAFPWNVTCSRWSGHFL
jgi:hypothetical protein